MSEPEHRLVVVGDADVADPLLHVAQVLRYPALVRTGDELPDDLGPGDHVVLVTTDLRAVRALAQRALEAGCAYVGVVGSGAACARLLIDLQRAGLPAAALARVAAPAGIDLEAAEPGEVAVSVAAELVRARRGTLPPRPPQDARD